MVRPRSGFSQSLRGPVNWAGLWSQTTFNPGQLLLTWVPGVTGRVREPGRISELSLQAGPGQGGPGVLSCGIGDGGWGADKSPS